MRNPSARRARRTRLPASGFLVLAPRRRRGAIFFGALASAASVCLALGACGEITIAPSSVHECNSSADCSAGDVCQFAPYSSCGAPGVCASKPDGQACITQIACGCNGATGTVCLVNGLSPAPIMSLGSCDGASQQQPFDAGTVPPKVDAASPVDAADSSTTELPDTSAPPPVDAGFDAGFDAGVDSSTPATLGTKCTSNMQCTDPSYPTCADPSSGSTSCHSSNSCICTTGCFSDTDCQPPSNGTCNLFDGINGACELK